jgi:phosphopantothenate synthetase
MHEIDKLIVAVVLIAIAFALLSVFAARLRVRHLKRRLVHALGGQDRWSQDCVLAELDDDTRTELLRRLGRNAG